MNQRITNLYELTNEELPFYSLIRFLIRYSLVSHIFEVNKINHAYPK